MIFPIKSNVKNFFAESIGPNNSNYSDEVAAKRNKVALVCTVASVAFAILATSLGMWTGFVVAGAAFISPRVGAAGMAVLGIPTGAYLFFSGITQMQFPLMVVGSTTCVTLCCLPILGKRFADLSELVQGFSLEGFALDYIGRPKTGFADYISKPMTGSDTV